ncbi:MAG: regulatory protein RecX [Bacteroidales bacterium]|nr:regulatory protein RecX [Bacteroidales bacterium]
MMTADQILSRMMALCSRREYCRRDIEKKIVALSQEVDAAKIIDRLCKEKFLDENRYSSAFVRDKSGLQGWGEAKIRYALHTKGVEKEAVEAALALLDEDSQVERLQKLLALKAKSVKADDAEQLRTKLLRFALSRGFSYQQAGNALKQLKL